jgi:hypothetical protein
MSDLLAIADALEAARLKAPHVQRHDEAHHLDIRAQRDRRNAFLQGAVEQAGGALTADASWRWRCRIGGVAATSTGGAEGAITNWIIAARKRAVIAGATA